LLTDKDEISNLYRECELLPSLGVRRLWSVIR
jgi:hypothetical protein